MEGERRRDLLEELERMVVRHRNPDVGPQRLELLADAPRERLHLGYVLLVLGFGERKELRRVRQHGAADDGAHCAPASAGSSKSARNCDLPANIARHPTYSC
jgi:hypothetical protein